MKFLKILKKCLVTGCILGALAGGLYAVYVYVLPPAWTQTIEEHVKGIKSDSGITGEDCTFDPVYCKYYDFLSEKAQQIYKQVYANALALETSFVPVVRVSADEVTNAIRAVFNDHPELFWLENGFDYKYNRKQQCVHITLHFNETADDIEHAKHLFKEESNRIVAEANALKNDYEKEQYVYHTLLDSVEYDGDAEVHQSAYSALVNGKSVCAGYARAFQHIMTQLQIPTYYCMGMTQGHAWNIVKLEDGYYNVDLSRADTTQNWDRYFNRTDKELKSSHKRSGFSYILPQCRATKYCEVE